jgi:GNAT superfamily N-acetyltransferase
MSEPAHPEPQIRFVPDGGSTRVELLVGEASVSRLWIIPFTICIGVARVRMDGIGGVGTDEAHRRHGYSRRVLEASVAWMRERDGALSMLYGIRDFYPKFGYATAGPDHFIQLTRLPEGAAMPAGWTARALTPGDLPAVRRLYDASTGRGVGACARREDGATWIRLREIADGAAEDDCRVILNPSGTVAGYLWEGRRFWYSDMLRHDFPEALVLSEVMAAGPAAADAALAAARLWAAEASRRRDSSPVATVLLSHPPEGVVAAAAMRQDARVDLRWSGCGSSMARVLDVERLCRALVPELTLRAQAARLPIAGTLRIETEIGAVTLDVGPDGVSVVSERGAPGGDRRPPAADFFVRLSQADLARLVLGVFPPGDMLARLSTPPDAVTAELIGVLFPRRHPHMWLPDRY